jgi:hypothetical protein
MKLILTRVDVDDSGYDDDYSTPDIVVQTKEYDSEEDLARELGYAAKDSVKIQIGEENLKEYIGKYAYGTNEIFRKEKPSDYDIQKLAPYEIQKKDGKWIVVDRPEKSHFCYIQIPMKDLLPLFPNLAQRIDKYKAKLVAQAEKNNTSETENAAKRVERKKARVLREAKELGLNVTVESEGDSGK